MEHSTVSAYSYAICCNSMLEYLSLMFAQEIMESLRQCIAVFLLRLFRFDVTLSIAVICHFSTQVFHNFTKMHVCTFTHIENFKTKTKTKTRNETKKKIYKKNQKVYRKRNHWPTTTKLLFTNI